MVGDTLRTTYFRPGALHTDDGVVSSHPFDDGQEEWVLIDGSPASCVQIGLYHVFQDREPFDLVISGPNYGRNTGALFALSSGTIGGALEGAVCGKKSIAISYAFNSRNHDPAVVAAASKLATELITKLYREWPDDVHIYNVNIPLENGVENAKIVYTDVLQNQWTDGSSYKEISPEDDNQNPDAAEQRIREGRATDGVNNASNPRRRSRTFKWSPNFADVGAAMRTATSGDGWAVRQGMVRYLIVRI